MKNEEQENDFLDEVDLERKRFLDLSAYQNIKIRFSTFQRLEENRIKETKREGRLITKVDFIETLLNIYEKYNENNESKPGNI